MIAGVAASEHGTSASVSRFLVTTAMGLAFSSSLWTAAGQLAPWEVPIPAQGDCKEGHMPKGCFTGDLRGLNWQAYLEVICRPEVPRELARDVVLQAMAHFNASSAAACPSGFAISMLALFGCGASEFEDQVVRFKPDGSSRFLIVAWDIKTGRAKLDWWSVTLPARIALEPPLPSWSWPGIFQRIKSAQDLSTLLELPASKRCDTEALEEVGCGGNEAAAELLQLFCARCTSGMATASTPSGLPCLYSKDLLDDINKLLEDARLVGKMTRHTCNHALLATFISLNGRASLVPPETDSKVYRLPWRAGRPMLVMQTSFKQVAQNPDNLFAFNVPMMSLSPFPFHTAMLRSARPKNTRPQSLYQALLETASLALARRGIGHVVLPGDASVGLWPEGSWRPSAQLSSFFVGADLRGAVAKLTSSLLEDLALALGGLWRLVPVSPGLWQFGEEPYRFAPGRGVPFRVQCPECVYLSLYFYVRDEAKQSILPLAPWTPCRIPWRRVFPAAAAKSSPLSSSTQLPLAADSAWLRMAERPPIVDATAVSGDITGSGEQHDSIARLRPQRTTCAQARAKFLHRGSDLGAALPELFWEAENPPESHLLNPAFDLSEGVHDDMGFYDLMRQREDSENVGLHSFSDKIEFKTRLVSEGIPIPRIYYMSNDSPDVLSVLQSLGNMDFVAKPTHLAATSFVYVMKDGRNLVSGQVTSVEEVAAGLRDSWQDMHVDDWATESTRPGIVVEELIDPPSRGGKPGSTPDELKCQTFFGRLFFCEWTFVQNMTSGKEGSEHFDAAHEKGDRARPSLGHKLCGIPNFASKGYVFRDGSCFDCAEPVPLPSHEAWRELVRVVEHAAAGTDHIRIDVFVTLEGKVVVNEANISFLKISKFPPQLVEEMRRRWLDGYLALRA
eukprot:TRINITY_DN47022_c0_g1_i1.p1 TRINITY_DN47022_c0_g1~~TRINITY_DN47022_c0_g1_i1.p1  ORF type:complete len:902 (+),score=150.85 TRINITY_DN47022_c0_g1_i1:31-2736(+)